MTADRRGDRRLARVHHASPYSQKTRNAKPSQQPKKSSGWSLTGFFSYFNPLWSRHSEEPEEVAEEETSQDEVDTNQSSQSSHDVFGSRTQPAQSPPATRPPDFFSNGQNQLPGSPTPQILPLPEPSASPLKNVDAVKTYLEQNGGRPLNQVEIAGLVSMLQDSIDNIDDDDQQPFRFSKSPSRAASPAAGSFPAVSSSTTLSNTTGTPKTPTRTLSKNPNGTYKWQGAGSARRNRYHSPAFGSPSSGNKIKLPPAETAKGDSKRRRVGQDAETSSPQRASVSRQSSAEPTVVGPSTASTSSAHNMNDTAAGPAQSKPQLNGINTSRLNKGTAPAVSSPLRQAWGQDDLPSPSSSPTSASRPTRAAAFMTELIREATPPKKPDVANPYQTASPVKTVKPPAKKPIRKPRAAAQRPPADEEKKQSEMSMQAVIEATLPKGSKRSRPPAHMPPSTNGSSETGSVDFPSQSPSPPPRQSSFSSSKNGSSTSLDRSKRVTVEEVEDEDELPSPKKQKKAPTATDPMIVDLDDGFRPPSQPFLRPSEVIEPGDAPQLQTIGLNGTSSSGPTISPTTAGRSFFGLKSSAPKEPSKLRFSIKADRDETISSAPSMSPTVPTYPKDAEAEVLSIATSDLPTEIFVLPRRMIREGRSTGELRAEKEVRGFANNDISMDDGWSLAGGQSNLDKTGSSTNPTIFPTSNTIAVPSTTTRGFDWDAAGLKPSRREGGWKCGTCDLTNHSSATEKCAVCDSPKPGAAKPSSTPFIVGAGSSTPDTMTTPTTTSTSSRGFNWGAAGLKPPTPSGWKCETCDLMNPASITEKCAVCDAPKPGGAEKPSASSFPSMPKPPSTPFIFGSGSTSAETTTTAAPTAPTNSGSQGFDWGAAGMNPPATNPTEWKCGTCDLVNTASAKEKCAVCDAPRPGIPSSDPVSGSKNNFSMPTPPSGPFTFGPSTSTSSTSTSSSGFSFGAPKSSGSPFTGFGSAPSNTATTASGGTGGGFNWNAAGLKPPSGDGWRCATCALMNPENVMDKCTVCDTPKP